MNDEYTVTKDANGNYLFPLHPNSLGAIIVRHAEKHVYPNIGVSALWMWNFPRVPSPEALELIKGIYANRAFSKVELVKAFEALA